MRKLFVLYRRYIALSMRYPFLYIVSWIAAILLLFVTNLTTFAVGWVVDTITAQGDYNLTYLIALIAVVLAIPVLIDPLTFKLKTLLMASLIRDLMRDVYNNVLHLDHQFHINRQTGKLISIILNTLDAVHMFTWQLEWFFFDHFASLVIPLILITVISWKVGLIIFVLLLAFMPVVYWILKLNMKKRAIMKETEYVRNSAIIDGLSNYETVRAFGNEKKEIGRLSGFLETSRVAMNAYQDTFRIIDLVGRLASVVIFLAAGLFAAEQYRNGEISLGTLIVIITFLVQITGDIFGMFFSVRDVLKHLPIIEDLFDLLDSKPTIIEDPHPLTLTNPRGEITFKNVTFAYEDNAPILQGLSLTIPAGHNVAFVGPSGGGKTTITRLIMRYYDIQKGSLTIDGVPVSKLSFDSLRELIGLVPQEPVLFNKTLAYNIGYALSDLQETNTAISQKIIEDAATKAHIHDFITSLPQGYDTLVGERGLKLSGGQKQRVAIARVLIKDPQIVIFDEATSMLDSASEKAIQLAFRELSKDKTTLIIAHRLSTITHCDTIFYIDKGKVVEQGTHQQLLKNNGPYATLWEIQSGGFKKG